MLTVVKSRWFALSGNVQGSLIILLCSLLAATMGALIKDVGQRIPVFEILFIRQICVILIISPVLMRTWRTVYNTDHLRFHVMRGCFAAVAMATGFTAVVHMQLAEVTAISFVRTLFTTLLAIIFLSESVGIRRWSVTVVGFIGVLIIVRPDTGELNIYALLALTSSLFVAAIMILLKKLSQLDQPSTIMTYQSTFITVIMAGPALYLWVPPTLVELIQILVIGGIMSIMQWMYIQAYKVAEAVAVAPMEYVRLLFATLIGIFWFSEVPTIWTILGASIIIVSTLYTAHRNAIKKNNPN